MNEDHVKGGVEKVGGRVKEAAGALTGDPNLKAEGQVDQVKGGAHQVWGNVKDAVKDVTHGAKKDTDTVTDRDPVVTKRPA